MNVLLGWFIVFEVSESLSTTRCLTVTQNVIGKVQKKTSSH